MAASIPAGDGERLERGKREETEAEKKKTRRGRGRGTKTEREAETHREKGAFVRGMRLPQHLLLTRRRVKVKDCLGFRVGERVKVKDKSPSHASQRQMVDAESTFEYH